MVTTQASPASRLLTIDQTMQALSYSRSTIYKLLSEGKLHAVSVNRTPRITTEEIERFIREELKPHVF